MLIVEGTSIKKSIRGKQLFNIDLLQVHAKQRIGIIGNNGSGKTSLLRIIAGESLPDDGRITPHTSIKLVPQLKEIIRDKSGGEITRQHLQNALRKQSGLLLLDEPTTHLDNERVDWLEKELKQYQGAIIIVSHDRTFLNHVCHEIWALEDQLLNVYKGNYDDYVRQKEVIEKELQTEQETFKREKEKLERAIRKKKERAERATKKPKNLSSSEARIKGVKTHYANIQKKLRSSAKALETRLDNLEPVKKTKNLPEIKMDALNEESFKIGRASCRERVKIYEGREKEDGNKETI